MNAAALIDRLAHDPAMIEAALRGVGPAESRWKPAPDAWSLVEIVNHLCDEETLDFRTRVDLTLHRPGEPWPPIDPVGWAIERGYQSRDLDESLTRFRRLREESLVFLRGLKSPDWTRVHEHPKIGPLRAGDLLASWAAHDLLHLRQIAKRRYEYGVAVLGEGYAAGYAGGW